MSTYDQREPRLVSAWWRVRTLIDGWAWRRTAKIEHNPWLSLESRSALTCLAYDKGEIAMIEALERRFPEALDRGTLGDLISKRPHMAREILGVVGHRLGRIDGIEALWNTKGLLADRTTEMAYVAMLADTSEDPDRALAALDCDENAERLLLLLDLCPLLIEARGAIGDEFLAESGKQALRQALRQKDQRSLERWLGLAPRPLMIESRGVRVPAIMAWLDEWIKTGRYDPDPDTCLLGLLIGAGADVNGQDSTGKSVLAHVLAWREAQYTTLDPWTRLEKDKRVLALLLEQGADWNAISPTIQEQYPHAWNELGEHSVVRRARLGALVEHDDRGEERSRRM